MRIELIERSDAESADVKLAAARARIKELFGSVEGFRMTPKIPREELYERGSTSISTG